MNTELHPSDSMLALNHINFHKNDGLFIPFIWKQHIQLNKKPHFPAMIILADIIYWITPVENIDNNGQAFLQRKTKDKKYKQSIQIFANKFGFEFIDAAIGLQLLKKLKIITYDTLIEADGTLFFLIDIIPESIKKIIEEL